MKENHDHMRALEKSTEIVVNSLKSTLDQEGDQSAQEIVDSAVEGKQFSGEQAYIIDKRIKKQPERIADGIRRAAELRQQDEVRTEIDRLYMETHPEEVADKQEDQKFRDEREIMKQIENGRQLLSKERDVVTYEANLVADFVSKFGIKEIDIERVRDSVLLMKDKNASKLASVLNPGRAGALGNGENRFIIINPKLLSTGAMGKITVDHEFLHMYQSPNCPYGLVEGTTCMYTEDAQKSFRRKFMAKISTLMTPYAPSAMAARIYEYMTSPEAMSEMYFGGDTTRLLEEFEDVVGSDASLKKQLEIFQSSRFMLKRMGPIGSQLGGIIPYIRDMGALGMASIDYARSLPKRLSH